MKLEYLDDLTGNGMYPYADPDKLIRLYDFQQAEAAALMSIIELSLLEKGVAVDVSALGFVEPVNCSLKLMLSSEDSGINLPAPNNQFVCALSRAGYEKMLGYMSFATAEKMNGYNWLYDGDWDNIDLLFSPGGTW